jgi:uncharacterized protein (DUF1501 family)
MFRICTGRSRRDCTGLSRRDFLHVGTLGLGGLTVANLLKCKASAAEAGNYVRDKAVVFLWLGGGPPQHETFDPKMMATAEVRSMMGEVKTTLPGVTFGGSLPLLAQRMNRLAIMRSFQTTTADHGPTGVRTVLAGRGKASAPSMGSIYSCLRGTNHPTTGMPTYALLGSGSSSVSRGFLVDGAGAGHLPRAYTAFNPEGTLKYKGGEAKSFSPILDNMRLNVPAERMHDRRALLQQLDGLSRELDAARSFESIDKYRGQAFEVLRGSVAQAFDLDKEDARTVARFDTSAIKVGHSKAGYRPSTLGKQLLLARRLCAAGAGFVVVESCGWDFHNNNETCGVVEGMNCYGPDLDKAVSAFLDDLEERGLSERILLVVTGEMGRTPTINKAGGRDHWANLAPLLLAGGGLKMGQVIGESDRNGGSPKTTPIKPANLMATILQTLFDVGQLRVQRGLPTDLVKVVENGEPIRELS